MAKPIKETPVLTGKDAKDFLAKMEQANSERITREVRERMRENYSQVQAIAK